MSVLTDGTEQGDLNFWTNGGAGITQAMRIQSNGNVGIGTTNPGGYKLYNNGTLYNAGAATFASSVTATNFISNVATGTQPYAATSITLNTNLNADLLDGQHGSYYEPAFSKNTAFNQNYGTSHSTVAYGDHNHAGVYDVAGAAAAVTPTTLGLVIGTNVQAYNSNLTGINQGLATSSSPSFTAVGATTFTGALTGHASLDALVGQAMYIGTTSVAINRASAALVLTGITSIDGSSASCTGNAATVTNGVYTGDARLTDARTPTAHTHGNITNTGYLGTTASIPLITGASGIIQAGAFGTSAGQFAEGNHTHSGVYLPVSGAGNIYTHNASEFQAALLSNVPHAYTANTSFTFDLSTYVNCNISTNTAITCTISNMPDGGTGQITVNYTGAAVVTFDVGSGSGYTIDMAPYIKNVVNYAYSVSVLTKGSGRGVYSYSRSGNYIAINGTQY
jgi:hypothetical protein